MFFSLFFLLFFRLKFGYCVVAASAHLLGLTIDCFSPLIFYTSESHLQFALSFFTEQI